MVGELAARKAWPSLRADLSRIDGVLISMVDGEQGGVQLPVRKVERGYELDGGEGVVERGPKLPAQFGQLAAVVARWNPPTRVDRMDCSATDQLQDCVAGLLQPQAPLDGGAVVAGELDHVG